MHEIAVALVESLPWIPIVVLMRILSNMVRHKRGLQTTIWHEIGVGLFLIYMAAVIQKTIPLISFLAGIRLQSTVNFVPFRSISNILHQGDRNYLFLNIFGNIALFVPIGFCVPLLWKKMRRPIILLALGFGLSLLIEALQIFISRGTDVDDLVLNTSGALMGYVFYVILNKLFPALTGKFLIKAK